MKTNVSRFTAALAAMLTLATAATHAATYYVSMTGSDTANGTSSSTAFKTIQKAVDKSKKGDTIIVADGTYAPITTKNLAITIKSVNGADVTSIDGGGAARCASMQIENSYVTATNTVLIGITLKNGYSQGGGSGDQLTGGAGGGAYGGTLVNCTLTGNEVYYETFGISWGAGAYESMLINCTLMNNRTLESLDGYCWGEGGGAHSSWLYNCTLSDNYGTGGGGAAYSLLYNCTLSNNSSQGGGGAYCSNLYNCTIKNNSVPEGEGGGANNCHMEGCIITGNTAWCGGGVAWCFQETGVLNCLIANNTAVGYWKYGSYNEACGGGAAESVVNNCTVVGNSSTDFNGGVAGAHVNNSIVWGNTASMYANYRPAVWVIGTGWVSSEDFYNSCTTPTPTNSDDGGGNTATDPLFVGGGDYHLQAGSPCIDKGRNFDYDADISVTHITAISKNAKDLSGLPRIQGGTVDMGAYEYVPPVFVTVTFDANGGTPAKPTKDVVYGLVYGSLPAVTRAGYALTGWFTAKTGGTQVTDLTTVTNAKAHTLYARWEVYVNKYDITLNPQSGTVTPITVQVSEGYAYGTLPVPTRASYYFLGWFTAASGGDKVTAATIVTSSAAHTLWAHWINSNVSVTFNADGGTFPGGGGTKTVTQSYGDYYAFPDTPARDGYVFLGWAQDSGSYDPLTASSLVDGTTAVKAWWKPADGIIAYPYAVGPGTTVPAASGAAVVNGKPVTLTAKPDKGAVFVEWVNAATGETFATPAIKVAPSEATLYVAYFRDAAECEDPEISGVTPSPNSMVGVPFSLKVSINEMAKPVKFTASKIPAGLKINPATGEIYGVPTKAGNFPTVIKATSVVNKKKTSAPQTVSITIEALPWNTVGTFNGYLYQGDNGVLGSFSATVSATGKLSAKVVTTNGVFSFTAPSWSDKSGDYFYVEAKTKGQTLGLSLDSADVWDAWQMNGDFNNFTCQIAAQRTPYINTNDPAPFGPDARTALARYSKDYYTLALLPAGAVSGTVGGASNVPEGNGYLAFTIGDKGVAKYAGKLADGTAVSGSASLLLWDNGDGASFTCFVQLYGKQGFVSGELRPAPNGQLDYWDWKWHYPGKTPTGKNLATEDRFGLWLTPVGGRYNAPASLAALYTGKEFRFAGTNVVIQANGTGLKLPPGKAPTFNKGDGNYYTSTPDNPFAATLTVNAKTGVFSGKVNDYDLPPTGKVKAYTYNHSGVLVQQAGVYKGFGFVLATQEWVDPGTQTKYMLQKSSPVTIE